MCGICLVYSSKQIAFFNGINKKRQLRQYVACCTAVDRILILEWLGILFLCFCCFYLLGVVVNISFYIELLPMAMDRNRQPFTQCTRDHILLIENNNNQNIPELTSQQFINWNTKKNSSKLLFFSRPVFALEIFFLTTCSSGVMKNVGHAAAFWTKTA